MTTTSKSVLKSFDNSTPLEVFILLFNRQVNVRVNHVLKLIRTSHLTLLVNLVDDNCTGVVLFSPVRDHLQTQDRGT